VQRHVGFLEQGVGTVPVRKGNTYRPAHRYRSVPDGHRLGDTSADPLGDGRHRGQLVDVLGQHDELVAPETPDTVPGPDGLE